MMLTVNAASLDYNYIIHVKQKVTVDFVVLFCIGLQLTIMLYVDWFLMIFSINQFIVCFVNIQNYPDHNASP